MNRNKFLTIAASSLFIAGGTGYLLSDRHSLIRADIKPATSNKSFVEPDEREILYLASLAPSGHNTQPWLVRYIAPYHWIVCNDKTRWLPAVDPMQRETVLSIGAFLQNLEYAAGHAGYNCQFNMMAVTNQDEDVVEVKLTKSAIRIDYDIAEIEKRRTVRSNYLNQALTNEDVIYLLQEEKDFFQYIPNNTTEYHYLNEKTIEANRIQAYRDDAENELSRWIRFSGKDARKYCDGLTTASMEIKGVPAWVVRNFYNKASVMKNNFRDKNIENVIKQVSQSAGWVLITSKDNMTSTLLETGKRMQRLFLKVRRRGVAMHPMTQALEEPMIKKNLAHSIGITGHIQFILRIGYVKNYPDVVSLRRSVDSFVRK
ncbi:MAG: hypothetical protein ABIQ88_22975 [Chitinophagaceae bacterium]